jgi:hypothetical protein
VPLSATIVIIAAITVVPIIAVAIAAGEPFFDPSPPDAPPARAGGVLEKNPTPHSRCSSNGEDNYPIVSSRTPDGELPRTFSGKTLTFWGHYLTIDKFQTSVRLDNVGFDDILTPSVGEVVAELRTWGRFRQLHMRLAAIGDAARNGLQRFGCVARGKQRRAQQEGYYIGLHCLDFPRTFRLSKSVAQ